jgi:hypothetical protein
MSVEEKKKKEAEMKKQNLFDAFKYVTSTRQVAFFETWEKVIKKKKEEDGKTSRLAKCARFSCKTLVVLVVLGALFPLLRVTLYNIMGWEHEVPIIINNVAQER